MLVRAPPAYTNGSACVARWQHLGMHGHYCSCLALGAASHSDTATSQAWHSLSETACSAVCVSACSTSVDHLRLVEGQAVAMLKQNERLEARMAALEQHVQVCVRAHVLLLR